MLWIHAFSLSALCLQLASLWDFRILWGPGPEALGVALGHLAGRGLAHCAWSSERELNETNLKKMNSKWTLTALTLGFCSHYSKKWVMGGKDADRQRRVAEYTGRERGVDLLHKKGFWKMQIPQPNLMILVWILTGRPEKSLQSSIFKCRGAPCRCCMMVCVIVQLLYVVLETLAEN